MPIQLTNETKVPGVITEMTPDMNGTYVSAESHRDKRGECACQFLPSVGLSRHHCIR